MALSESTTQWIIIGLTVITGFVTLLIKAFLDYKLNIVELKLQRIDEQINKLYGPLRMLDISNYLAVNWLSKKFPEDIVGNPKNISIPEAYRGMANACKDLSQRVSGHKGAHTSAGPGKLKDPYKGHGTQTLMVEFKKMVKEILLKNVDEMVNLLKKHSTLLNGFILDWMYQLELHRRDLAYIVDSWEDRTAGFADEGFKITDEFILQHRYPVKLTEHINTVYRELKRQQAEIFGKIPEDQKKYYTVARLAQERYQLQQNYEPGQVTLDMPGDSGNNKYKSN